MTTSTGKTNSSRDRIVGIAKDSLHETIYAGAGAGTGKTQTLVERIANLVTLGGVLSQNIAAVTFTVAAASELRQRVREELEKRLEESAKSTASGSSGLQSTLSNALDSLDSAFVGTIHSFAQSLLRERPLSVGLPPVFEVYESVQGDVRFGEEWSAWLDNELDSPTFADAVVNAQRLGLTQPLNVLRELAEELHANYDLVERIGELPMPENTIGPGVILRAVRADLGAALDLRSYCTNPDDNLIAHMESSIVLATTWIDEATENDSEEDQTLALTQLPKLSSGGGRKGDWNSLPSGESSLEEVRASLKGAQANLERGREGLGQATVIPLVNSVSRMVLEYSAKRRNLGTLEFQDLLMLSSELLDQDEEARRYFQSRYTHILIDEFQDTDPLQLKLAMRLADRDSKGKPTPGALFVVGDSKQSIYRFRRADLTQLEGLVNKLGATKLSLSNNYRSNPEILNWVNSIFEPWMNGSGGSVRNPNQAEYVALEPGRNDYLQSNKSRVMIAGGAADSGVDVARESEADDFAKLARSVGAGEWSLPGGSGGERESTYRDLCVLMPRRTGLAFLENAFHEHNVPYVLEGQAPIFDSQTVHELSNNLVAIDDPTDQVAIVAALKSASWGCSDQDLYEWAQSGRKFEYARAPIKLDQFVEGSKTWNVATALSGLEKFHELRQQISTPFLIEQFIRERRLREVAALSNPSGDRERLMDLLIEMSRSLQRSGTGSLREFVRWISRQAEARVRVAEGALSNSEVNAVRVMTIHAAKGLEFPVVALMGLQVSAGALKGSSITREEQGRAVVSVKLGSTKRGLFTSDYTDKAKAEKEAEQAELVRLAYVAATRAREYLIVSVHRSATDKSSLAAKIAELDGSNGSTSEFAAKTPSNPSGTDTKTTIAPESNEYSLVHRSQWLDQLELSVATAKNRGYVTPSQLADHSMFDGPKPEDNMESTERNTSERGRGGTRFGSAVHAVLQDVDFDDRNDLDGLNGLVQAAADAHEVEGAEIIQDITQSVRNTLQSPTVARATSSNSWREAWVAAEISDGIEVEGSIDLMIQNEDGSMTIVDYKTDRIQGELLDERAKGYEPQLAGYVLILEKLGMSVRDAILVFANGGADGGAYEYSIKDMEVAKSVAETEIRSQIR